MRNIRGAAASIEILTIFLMTLGGPCLAASEETGTGTSSSAGAGTGTESKPDGAGTPEITECLKFVAKNYALRHSGDYQSAEEALKSANGLAKSELEKSIVANAFGGLYMHIGRHSESEKWFREALKITEKLNAPDSARLAAVLDNLSVECAHNKKYTEAESFNKRARDIFVKYKDSAQGAVDLQTVLSNRAFILGTQEKWSESVSTYEEAVDLCRGSRYIPPELYATTMDNLSGAYCHLRDFKKAESAGVDALALFESALGSNHPETNKCRSNLAFIYEMQGKLPEADQLLKSAIEKLEAGGPATSRLLAGCKLQHERVRKAIAGGGKSGAGGDVGDRELEKIDLSKLSADERETTEGYQNLRKGDLDLAIKFFQNAIKKNPKQAGAYGGLALVYKRKKETDLAIENLTQALKYQRCPEFYFGRGDEYVKKKEWALAIDDLKKCLEMDEKKRFSVANFMLGACCLELKQASQAEPYFDAFIELERENPNGYAFRSIARHILGKEELARQDMIRARELGFNPK